MSTLMVNGRALKIDAAPNARLLDVLRDGLPDGLRLVGTREGCGAHACGACHVLIDGNSVAACDTPLWAAQGKAITTVEGLDPRLAQAFADEQAAQCGFCSSGMLVAAAALLRGNPQPSDAEVREALDGHLCRCGAHNRIVRAVLRAAAAVPAP